MAGVTSVVIDGTSYLVDDINAVDFSEDQGLSEQQQQQGRSNIGAAALAALAGKADKADLDALEGTVGELSDDVDALTEALADKASAIVDTASGAIASFPDGAAVPAKDITIGIEPVQSGSGDPSPTNVRPISGWTGANVTRAGKNLLSVNLTSQTKSGVTITVNGDGTMILSGTTSGYLFLNLNYVSGNVAFPAGSYLLNGGLSLGGFSMRVYDSGSKLAEGGGSSDIPFTIPSNTTGNYIRIDIESGITFNNVTIKPMVRLSTVSDATFAPSSNISHTISWQSEAGTVYGGTLDVTTGLLTVTMAEVDLGTLTWVKSGNHFYTSNLQAVISSPVSYTVPTTAKCSKYKSAAFGGVYGETSDYSLGVQTTPVQSKGVVTIYDSSYASSDASTFKAAMSGAQLVYELVTPQTYQLTPTEVTLLLGYNNVWADTGDTTVAYRADTKLYIQKINAPTDDDMIADAQIASGRYFIVGGNLYKSTTTIPAGDTINPGSNCILTNLADALNALNALNT